MELGGNIELDGFSDVSVADMVIVKKMVGNFAKKISDRFGGFDRMKVTIKPVHKSASGNSKFEIHTNVSLNGKTYASEVVDFNQYFAMDESFKKVLTTVETTAAKKAAA